MNYGRQQGFFAILAVILILVMGVMGSIIAYMLSNRAQLSVMQLNGLRAFYIAESGLEIGTRLLTMPALTGTPSRVSCGALTGTSTVTNASLFGQGTFTLTTFNTAPQYTFNTLSTAETASDTTINATSTSGFTPNGRIIIDREAIDYAGISGNTFIGITRGAGGTTASSHTSGTRFSQFQCSIDSDSGVPNLTSPKSQRNLQWNVQMQEAWLVANLSGSNYIFSHWNRPTEKAWTQVTVAAGSLVQNLTAVSLTSNADGWAVGNTDGTTFILLRYNGSNWVLNSLAGACSGQHLRGVSMVSSREAWAVGLRSNCASPAQRYTVLRWNGSTWSELTPTTIPADNSSNQDLNAVSVVDTNADGQGNIGFAVGNNGDILRYNGSTWTKETPPSGGNLNGVYTVSASEAWAVGENGRILRWNGSSWGTSSSGITSGINAIAMLDTDGDGLANKGFAVGDSGRILSYNGSSWSLTDLGGTNFFAVGILNENDAWVAGAGGAAYHWDGSTWTSISSGTNRQINGISVVTPNIKPVSNWTQIFS